MANFCTRFITIEVAADPLDPNYGPKMAGLRNLIAQHPGHLKIFRQHGANRELLGSVAPTIIPQLRARGKVEVHSGCPLCGDEECAIAGSCETCGQRRCEHKTDIPVDMKPESRPTPKVTERIVMDDAFVVLPASGATRFHRGQRVDAALARDLEKAGVKLQP